MTNTNQIFFSNSAYQNGFGSAKFKSVNGQTKAERELVKSGAIVLFDSGRKSGGSYGTTIRQIVYQNGCWNPRVPSDDVLERFDGGDYETAEYKLDSMGG